MSILATHTCENLPTGSGIPVVEKSGQVRFTYSSETAYSGYLLPPEYAIDYVSKPEWQKLREAHLNLTQSSIELTATRLPIEQLLIRFSQDSVSDVYFEMETEQVHLRTRQADGKIIRHSTPITAADIDWIKMKAGLKGTQENTIEEGHLSLQSPHRIHRYRLSAIKTIQGESLVLRHIESDTKNLPTIKLPEAILPHRFLEQGLMLFAGVTGSGKSTTLHQLISHPHFQTKKVISIEDPIEFTRPNTTQSNADNDNNWTFDLALSHFLRADPDVLVVGELRDKVTIELAVRAALTGHAVYGTIHSPSAEMVSKRLEHYGISKNLITETLKWVIHQQLIPKSCQACQSKDPRCPHCAGKGTLGRMPKFKTLIHL